MVPAEGGPKFLKLESSWHRRRRSKILAVSIQHWKGRGGGGGGLLLRCTAVLSHPCYTPPPTAEGCGDVTQVWVRGRRGHQNGLVALLLLPCAGDDVLDERRHERLRGHAGVGLHVNHTAPRHGRGGGHGQVLHLEHDVHVPCEREQGGASGGARVGGCAACALGPRRQGRGSEAAGSERQTVRSAGGSPPAEGAPLPPPAVPTGNAAQLKWLLGTPLQ